MDKLHAMRVFEKIAEQGSLTAAANVLGKSLPSVVRILAALEESIQVRLFNRTTRRIALTEEGRVYLARCRKILADIEECELELRQDRVEPRGLVTMTAPARFGEMYVAPSVTRFLLRYPHVQINLLLLDRVVNLLDEGIDLAVRIAQLDDSSLIARPLRDVRQVVCASPELLSDTASGVPQHPKSLSALPCVRFGGISPGSVWYFRDKGKRLGVEVSGSFMCNQVSAAVDACVSGLGFGLFYNYQVMPRVESGELKIILSDFEPDPLPLNLVYPHAQLMASRVRKLVDWLAGDLRLAAS
jgi:DNA-binding transcriptional LysR family regulator